MISPIEIEDHIKISERYKQQQYSFLTVEEMSIKLWTQEKEFYLDAKIHLGSKPISIAITAYNTIIVLTEA